MMIILVGLSQSHTVLDCSGGGLMHHERGCIAVTANKRHSVPTRSFLSISLGGMDTGRSTTAVEGADAASVTEGRWTPVPLTTGGKQTVNAGATVPQRFDQVISAC